MKEDIGKSMFRGTRVDWKALIDDLTKAGLTQEQIAEKCGVVQSTISDLHRGATRLPNYLLADKLRELHKLETQH